MSKRNISYIKPEDPSFLKRMKQQIGYENITTVDTKKNNQFEDIDSDDSEDIIAEEQPQIVVLKPGDLSSEEFNIEKLRLEKEASEKPADLSEKIIFKTKKIKHGVKEKSIDIKISSGGGGSSSSKNPIGTKLSFDFEDSDN